MKTPNITNLRTIPFTELMEALGIMIDGAHFEADPDEYEVLLEQRLQRTLDQAPQLYAFLLEATSYLSYWTAMGSSLGGIKSEQYLDMREKRDAVERFSKAVKLYYDSASRRITLLQMQSERESGQK